MIRALREYYERTGYRVGFKPAGGISAAKQVRVRLLWATAVAVVSGKLTCTPVARRSCTRRC